MTPRYTDLALMPEDDRITLMGAKAAGGHLVGFFVDNDVVADRYVAKLTERYAVQVLFRGPGPVFPSIFVKIGPTVECICRTASCGHRASEHRGPNGACLICQQECWA